MAVEHDEYFLLSVAVDAAHGDVDVVVAVHDVHARHIGFQYFLKIPGARVADHLFGDQRGGHRYLTEGFLLTGGSGEGGGAPFLDLLHNLCESHRILGRDGVIRRFCQQHPSIALGFLGVVISQIAERHQPVSTFANVALEIREMLFQQVSCFFETANIIIFLSLVVDGARIVLLGCHRQCQESCGG